MRCLASAVALVVFSIALEHMLLMLASFVPHLSPIKGTAMFTAPSRNLIWAFITRKPNK